MSDSVAVSVIAGLSSISVAIITVVVKDYLDRKKAIIIKEKEETIAESDLHEMVIVHDWLNGLREKYDFERLSIFQFHNGGKFFQGKSMKKFSMTYESVAPGYEKIKRSFQNVLCSEYPHWISKMTESKIFFSTTSEMEHKDRYELEQLGVKQFVTVPIRCLKGHLIGFMVGYNIADIDKNIKEKFPAMVESSKFISGYLI
jgi:hypothetical protein